MVCLCVGDKRCVSAVLDLLLLLLQHSTAPKQLPAPSFDSSAASSKAAETEAEADADAEVAQKRADVVVAACAALRQLIAHRMIAPSLFLFFHS